MSNDNIFARDGKPVNELLLSEANAIADELIRRFSMEQREEIIWYISRRICFTCGIYLEGIEGQHSHLVESDEI